MAGHRSGGAKQAEAIKRWKPWSQSTEPRTEKGKAVTSQNALVHGLRSASWLEERRRVNDMLGECRAVEAGLPM
jgi:hypothetical protein